MSFEYDTESFYTESFYAFEVIFKRFEVQKLPMEDLPSLSIMYRMRGWAKTSYWLLDCYSQCSLKNLIRIIS